MNHVKTCGAVVYTVENGKILYLIVESLKGIHGFPKGHAEIGETEKESAFREIKEETGISVDFVNDFRIELQYSPDDKPDTMKHLVLFIAKYDNQEISIQKEELLSANLMDFESAMKIFEFDNYKNALKKADEFIKSHNLVN